MDIIINCLRPMYDSVSSPNGEKNIERYVYDVHGFVVVEFKPSEVAAIDELGDLNDWADATGLLNEALPSPLIQHNTWQEIARGYNGNKLVLVLIVSDFESKTETLKGQIL